MTVKEKPGEMTMTRVDTNTLARLKILSGSAPVARYLRELSTSLAADIPPTLDELSGGYSLTPIKMQLDNLTAMVSQLIQSVRMIDEKTWAAYEKEKKANFDMMLVQGMLLSFIDSKYPGAQAAIIAQAKEASDSMWPDELKKINPGAPNLKDDKKYGS